MLYAGGMQLLCRYEGPPVDVTLDAQDGLDLRLWAEAKDALPVDQKNASRGVLTGALGRACVGLLVRLL